MRLSRRAMLVRVAGVLASTVLLGSLATQPEFAARIVLEHASPTPAPSTIALSLGLSSQPCIDELPLLHLVQSGAFQRGGIEVQVSRSAGDFESLPALLAGKVQLALLDLPTAYRAISNKAELIGVFQLYWTDPTVVLALSRPGLDSAAGLAGRAVGLSAPHGAPLLALATALGAAALPLSAVQLVVTGTNPASSLERGEVQAASTSFHLVSGFEAAGLRVVVLPRNGWDTIPGPVLVTTRHHMDEQRSAVRRFVGTLRRGILELIDQADQLQPTAATLSPGQATRPRVLQAQVAAVLASLRAYRSDVGPGWFDNDRLAAADRFLRDLDPGYSGIEPAAAFVNELLSAGPGA
jgi:ABC-type nitrate/sulfonate/bicarbonate transport system substrate-binding protein